jgi:hypothetical protein
MRIDGYDLEYKLTTAGTESWVLSRPGKNADWYFTRAHHALQKILDDRLGRAMEGADSVQDLLQSIGATRRVLMAVGEKLELTEHALTGGCDKPRKDVELGTRKSRASTGPLAPTVFEDDSVVDDPTNGQSGVSL